jgi:putative transposase
MLYWAKGTLPGLGTSLVDADISGATSRTRKKARSMRQLGEKKRQKSQSNSANNKLEDVETSSSSEAN